MASQLQPEFFSLLSINIFLALSLLTCLFETNFPTAIPYVYQSAALFGFGQLWISKEFSLTFGDEMRFWYNLVYLSVAMINIVAVDLYLAFTKRQRNLSWIYSGTVVFPSLLVSAFFVSVYTNGIALSLPKLPQIPLETVYVYLCLCVAILGVGMLTSNKPDILEGIHLSQLVPRRAIALTSSAKSIRKSVINGKKQGKSAIVRSREILQTPSPLQKTGKRWKKASEKLSHGSRSILAKIRFSRLLALVVSRPLKGKNESRRKEKDEKK